MDYTGFLQEIYIIPAKQTIAKKMIVLRLLISITQIILNIRRSKSFIEKLWGVFKVIGYSLILVPSYFVYKGLLQRLIPVIASIWPVARIAVVGIKALIKLMNINFLIPILIAFSSLPVGLIFTGISLSIEARILSTGASSEFGGRTTQPSIVSKLVSFFKFDLRKFLYSIKMFIVLVGRSLSNYFNPILVIFRFFKRLLIRLTAKIRQLLNKLRNIRLEESLFGTASGFLKTILSFVVKLLFKGPFGIAIGLLLVLLYSFVPAFKRVINSIPILRTIFTALRSVGLKAAKIMHLDVILEKSRDLTTTLKAAQDVASEEQKG